MPSDHKKQKALAKKEAQKKKPNVKQTLSNNVSSNNLVAECSNHGGLETTSTDILKSNGMQNGISFNSSAAPNNSKIDPEYEGSDEESNANYEKMASHLECLNLTNESVAKYRSATGVLASHPDARDLQFISVSVNFHGKELLTDSRLDLTSGRRYGLIGRNGCGKSTLLAVLANREIPLPKHVDIFLLQREMSPSTKTALQCVMDVDEERAQLEAEAEALALRGDDSELAERLITVYERLDELDSSTAESRAAGILSGLGFTPLMQRKQVCHFSGGWRMRISLARALFVRPALLLLDEPTNHLDLKACVWLEQELREYPRCLLVISHSQDFLNGVCSNIINVHERKLVYYTGNFDQYMKVRMELEENQMKRYKWEQDQMAHMKDYIARFGHGSRKLARQAQSKEKVLQKMVDGGLTKKVSAEKSLVFYFPDCGELPPPVIQVQNASYRYNAESPWIYRNIDFGFDLDCRVALVGPNGAGKSTLLKLLSGELEATEGMIRRHTHLKIGRYHQHLHEMLDIEKSAIEYLQFCYPDLREVDEVRRVLGRYGLTGQQQTCPIKSLSDGQRCRIIFAWLAQRAPHILLLDEPTNHLDIETIDSLAWALNDFEGGMLLVSHDFRLIQQVAEEIWVCENQTITKWPGDIFSYKAQLTRSVDKEVRLRLKA